MLVHAEISTLRYQKVLNWGIGFFFSLILLIPFGMLLNYLFLYGSENQINKTVLQGRRGEKIALGPQESSLDASMLSLKEINGCGLILPEVLKNLHVFENRLRPDHEESEELTLMGFEHNLERKFVHKHKKTFLNCTDKGEFSFVEEKSPFWFEVILKEEDSVTLDLHVEFMSEKGDVLYSEVQSVKIPETKNTFPAHLFETGDIAAAIAYLNEIKVLEADILIETYGGVSYKDVKGLYRVYKDGLMPFFIKSGDLFIWKDGKLEQKLDSTKNFPLILVQSVDAQKCEFVIWDVEGVYYKTVSLPITRGGPSLFKPVEVFSKIHQRTENSVTCQLQKRNMILRKGDWILYSKDRFRNLRTFGELKDYLRYALKGELFIFDGLVKKDGLTFFTGTLFNEERTVAKKIEIPLSEPKKNNLVKKKEQAVPVQVRNE